MAQYEHLPIFKLSYDLLIDLYKIVSTVPKEHKYTIGEKIKNYSLDLDLLLDLDINRMCFVLRE